MGTLMQPLKKDGSVLTWGESRYGIDMYNNNTNNIQESLSSGVLRVYSTDTGFAALKDDKTVVFWGQYGDFEDIADGSYQILQKFIPTEALSVLQRMGKP